MLTGGAGDDQLYGDAGADVFVFDQSPAAGGTDRIVDFVLGVDRIDLSAMDADALPAGDQSFTFIGAALFSGVAGELRYDAVTGRLLGDVTGNANADLTVNLDGVAALGFGDLIL
ncbi:M10 family metallopeptidase C-terminal domain-containing protein [Tabrizicola sp. DMG-N-6]|uniref:M10 family metallopeptidase C-terminal domain-containing protein n=1 Tax=Szabonella alba TaxID=2804194 RepID=A0A8K0VH73_9RHOB|nr:M10 family metallopeptidase C-terminal domain-containing protein [Szabonella alba]